MTQLSSPQPSTAATPHSKQSAGSEDIPSSWLRGHTKLLVPLLVVSLAALFAADKALWLRVFGQSSTPISSKGAADRHNVKSTAFEQPMAHASKIVRRLSQARGHADYGFLKSFHTFSFAECYDADYQQFGALRVINEDRMSAQDKLGMHPHREMEIFSYISSGQLTHGDSMQNVETIRAGDIQMTSAGTGIKHSEFNSDKTKECHFLQIWALPHTPRLAPKYYARSFTAQEKRDKLGLVVAPIGTKGVVDERDGPGPTPIHSHLALWATIMSRNKTLSHTYMQEAWPGSFLRRAYVHVAQTSGYNTKEATGATVLLNGHAKLREGDGAFIHVAEGDHSLDIANIGDNDAEVLVFDL